MSKRKLYCGLFVLSKRRLRFEVRQWQEVLKRALASGGAHFSHLHPVAPDLTGEGQYNYSVRKRLLLISPLLLLCSTLSNPARAR